eukprot:TRINITY_DN7455_c0_g1_i1.p1 TRINITY_DN7455_c0_g1~~TRINITY_DN7455_c0_g1_i1.p1  ORF type:complete len:432 (+),score=67.13 TRINITY_DN7455_c0_g1_i1:100-1395(+)
MNKSTRVSNKSSSSHFKSLLSRQLSDTYSRRYKASDKQFSSKFHLEAQLDTHPPDTDKKQLPFGATRSRQKITEVITAHDLLFALSNSGVCTVFSRARMKKICYLNLNRSEVIRSMIADEDYILLVVISATDHYSSLKCRFVSLDDIKKGHHEQTEWLFEREDLTYPGFIEVDSQNKIILTRSASSSIHKVWNLRTFELIYEIKESSVEEIKMTPGFLLLVGERKESYVPLKVLAAQTGKLLMSFNQLLHRGNLKIEFVDIYDNKVFIKQQGQNVQIVDIRTKEVKTIDKSIFQTPSASIFLHKKHHLLTFKDRSVQLWNLNGELVTRYDDHDLERPDSITNFVHISHYQDFIVSYCRDKKSKDDPCIHISNTFSGKLVSKITGDEQIDDEKIQQKRQALSDITSLHYNEEMGEIYTGGKDGMVSIFTIAS